MLDQPGDAILQPAAELGQGNHHQCYCVPGYRWTCVRTHTQAERWAQANLERSGYRTYLPLVSLHRPDRAVATMVHRVTVPAFTGYVFVQHDPATSWGPIRDTPGVSSVLRCGNRIVYARSGAVEAVRSALQASEALAATRPPKNSWAAPGVPCRPRIGVFRQMPAVILSVGQDMALVSIMFLGELREVALDLDCIEPRDGG